MTRKNKTFSVIDPFEMNRILVWHIDLLTGPRRLSVKNVCVNCGTDDVFIIQIWHLRLYILTYYTVMNSKKVSSSFLLQCVNYFLSHVISPFPAFHLNDG